MDIVFHIGLSKCASSTLQNRVFFELPGYLGTQSELSWEENFAKQFKSFCPLAGRKTFDLDAARAWRDRVLKHLSARGELGTCILSDENLSSSNSSEAMPIIPSLKAFSDEIWVDGNVKVILVIRNQLERLGSLYAQYSNSRFDAGQEDFQSFIDHCLVEDGSLSLRYSEWVFGLRQALGAENVLILLLEDMSEIQFWLDLCEFCGMDQSDAIRLQLKSVSRHNVRSKGGREWNIRPLDMIPKTRAATKILINRLVPKPPAKVQESILYKPLFSLARSWYSFQAMLMDRKRSDVIVMTEVLEESIRALCSEDNRRLEELLNRDLKALGYPI